MYACELINKTKLFQYDLTLGTFEDIKEVLSTLYFKLTYDHIENYYSSIKKKKWIPTNQIEKPATFFNMKYFTNLLESGYELIISIDNMGFDLLNEKLYLQYYVRFGSSYLFKVSSFILILFLFLF